MITSEIIADSINSQNCRMTSFVLEYPRYIHSEVMTHRAFSKNAASSRAIPIEKMIEQIQENPAIPSHWGKNQPGMKANEELDDIVKKQRAIFIRSDKEYAKDIWLRVRDKVIQDVEELNNIGLHKQISNRILEPWFHIKIILSGTEFENFFALRAHPDAHPDFQKLAYLMLEQYNSSEPISLQPGQWHIPFGDTFDEDRISNLSHLVSEKGGLTGNLDRYDRLQLKIKIAIARCARISYLNFEGKDDYEADIKLCDRLFGSIPKHLSPTEHVAQSQEDDQFYGNLKGFKPYRKFFDEENLTDSRVIKKFYKG